MAKSIAHERREVFYPDPVYKRRLEQLSQLTGESKSAITNQAIREFLDKKKCVR